MMIATWLGRLAGSSVTPLGGRTSAVTSDALVSIVAGEQLPGAVVFPGERRDAQRAQRTDPNRSVGRRQNAKSQWPPDERAPRLEIR
jgi:hypothetical protein